MDICGCHSRHVARGCAAPEQMAHIWGSRTLPPVSKLKARCSAPVFCIKPENIPRVAKNEAFHTNPKHLRGNDLRPSLALLESVACGREQSRPPAPASPASS